MKQIVRMYRRHDIDLVTIYKTAGISLHKAMYNSLKSYVNKTPYLIKTPTANVDMTLYNFKSHYQIILNLDDKKDADIISWLKKVKKGMRNAAIKAIIRGCLVGPAVYACSTDDTDRLASNILCEEINKKVTDIKDTPVKNNKNAKKTSKTSKTTSTPNGHTSVLPINEIKEKIKEGKKEDIKPTINKEPVLIKEKDNRQVESIDETTTDVNFDNIFSGMEIDSVAEDKQVEENDTFDMFGDIASLLNQI